MRSSIFAGIAAGTLLAAATAAPAFAVQSVATHASMPDEVAAGTQGLAADNGSVPVGVMVVGAAALAAAGLATRAVLARR